MRRYFLVLIVLAALLLAWVVSAQDGFPVGYQTVYTAPTAGMHPLNYQCTMTVYDATNHMAPNNLSASVDAYIIWVHPARPPEYDVSYTLNGSRFWEIYSQQTLDAICK